MIFLENVRESFCRVVVGCPLKKVIFHRWLNMTFKISHLTARGVKAGRFLFKGERSTRSDTSCFIPDCYQASMDEGSRHGATNGKKNWIKTGQPISSTKPSAKP